MIPPAGKGSLGTKRVASTLINAFLESREIYLFQLKKQLCDKWLKRGNYFWLHSKSRLLGRLKHYIQDGWAGWAIV